MKKRYRLLTQEGYPQPDFVKGQTYDSDYLVLGNPIEDYVLRWPHNWELVEGDNEENHKFDFDKAYASLAAMQKEKDKKYGNSALKPLDIFSKHHPYGSRLDEKLARVKNCDELRKNDVADLIGGLMVICQSKGWDNFEDLID